VLHPFPCREILITRVTELNIVPYLRKFNRPKSKLSPDERFGTHRMLATPPQPHSEMKVGKPRGKGMTPKRRKTQRAKKLEAMPENL
jgi:hypothetical protein